MGCETIGPNRTHGIRGTYTSGCRCELCKDAQRDYDRTRVKNKEEWRQKRRPKNEEWKDLAACSNHPNTYWWHAADNPGQWRSESVASMTAKAKLVCAGCPVIVECAEYARDEPWGIWAGLTATERGKTARRYRIKRGSSDC